MASTELKTGSTRSFTSGITTSNGELCDDKDEEARGETTHGVRRDIRGGHGDGVDRGITDPSDGLTTAHGMVTPDG